MKLWLDDVRDPAKYGYIGWYWVKTAKEAISALKTGWVTEASLDHDLAWEHYPGNDNGKPYKELTGYDVVVWMNENNVWPCNGVSVHSMNPWGRNRMEAAIPREHFRMYFREPK